MGTRDGRVESGEGIEQCNYAVVVGWLDWGDIEAICVIHSSSSIRIRRSSSVKTSVMRCIVHMSCIMNRGIERS